MATFDRMKKAAAALLAPAMRHYIRYSPLPLFKTSLWRRVHWRDRSYVARTRFGSLMAGRSLDLVQGYIYYFGVWEPNLTAFVQRRLRGSRDRTFVDVGANVGYFSLLAARRMPHGRVVSIEAHPDIHAKLLKNIDLNGYRNIRTVNCAAAAGPCRIVLFHAGPLNEGATTSVPSAAGGDAVRVEGRSMADILSAAEVKSARLVKIDVEGAEHEVVKGMRPMLSDFPDDVEIVMEIAPSVDDDPLIAATLKVFEDAGFFPYGLTNSYAPMSYLKPAPVRRPQRLRSAANLPTDVVFSRIDAEYL